MDSLNYPSLLSNKYENWIMKYQQFHTGFSTMNYVTTIFLLGAVTSSVAYGEESQSYVANLLKIEEVELKGERKVIFSKLKPIKRENYLNGSIEFFEDMNNEEYQLSVEMFTSPLGNGVYKKMPMEIPPTGVCEAFAKFFREFLQPSLIHGTNTNIPYIEEEGVCPLPAGEYYFKEILFNTDSWPNQFPRGTMKVDVHFYQNFVEIGGLIVYVNIEDDTR